MTNILNPTETPLESSPSVVESMQKEGLSTKEKNSVIGKIMQDLAEELRPGN